MNQKINLHKGLQKKRLYIHIGTHKTGTTSLQYFLHRNMQRLYDLDFLYPSTGRHPRAHVQHSLVARAFKPTVNARYNAGFNLHGNIDRKILLAALFHEIELSGRKNIILSSEELYTMTDEQVSDLYHEFSEFEIHPIIYIRNFVDMAQSFYQTFVTHGNVDCNFEEFDFENKTRIDLLNICRAWSRLSSKQTIVCKSYGSIGKSIILDFLEILDLHCSDLDMSTADDRLNATMKPCIVTIVRDLRKFNVDPQQVSKLTKFLNKITITEPQTNIPKHIRTALQERYSKEKAKLIHHGFLSSTGVTEKSIPPHDKHDPKYINDIPSAILAIISASIKSKATANRT